jgi:hypothetical protein
MEHDEIDAQAEREAIIDALAVLRAIQREKLDFPYWNKTPAFRDSPWT